MKYLFAELRHAKKKEVPFMTKKKRYVCLILSVVSAFCLLTAALFYGGTVPLRATAQTENSIWSGTQTSKNFLPVLSADSDIAGLGFTFSHNHTYQIHLTGRGSYGIRPTDDYDDIGDGSSYRGSPRRNERRRQNNCRDIAIRLK